MTLDPGYFRDCYRASADPYGLADRWYEARKYALTIALLPGNATAPLKPGCSIGVLTAQLASRCDSLLACDAVSDAVTAARSRTAGLPGVRVEQRVIPAQWPPHSFDLIVFSELLYYFDDADLDQVLRLGIGGAAFQRAPARGALAAPAPDHPRTGDGVHETLAGHPGLARLAGYRDPDFTARSTPDPAGT